MAELTNREYAALWFEDVAEKTERLTSGNVSHMGATIRGKAIRCAEYVRKHIND